MSQRPIHPGNPGLVRIPHLDPADTPEGRGIADETADFFFHPSRPSGLSYLIQRKTLIHGPKLVRGAGRMPFHLGNPGLVFYLPQSNRRPVGAPVDAAIAVR